ncbi:MAG: Holliday junction branch migration protein RuvA [Burkholderiaceae bacterium]
MIGRIAGVLLQRRPPQVLVDAHGVGYEIDVPMSTLYDLPPDGQPVVLLTHQVVREDAHLLYGFLTEAERDAFRQLLRVNGVGPRIALAVLSGMSVGDLVQTVALQEPGRLTRIPGIGKRTAERMLLDLKGRLVEPLPAGGGAAAAAGEIGTDVLHALLALGYSDKEAGAAIRALPAGIGVSEGIKHALKALAKG